MATEEKWKQLRATLEEARDSHDGVWWDKEEINRAMREASVEGVSPYLVLACHRACECHVEFGTTIQDYAAREWKVLCIDDEAGITRLLKANLERGGRYKVGEENDPLKALDTIREFKPDIVLLDLIMRGVDGTEVLQSIKKDESLRSIPVIVLSSLVGEVDDGDGGITKDGVLYLAKPINLKDLTHCIEKHLFSVPEHLGIGV